MYARSPFVITGDDGEEWSPHAFERFALWTRRKIGATGRLYRDNGSGAVSVDSRFVAYRIPESDSHRVVPAASAGYLGGTLTMTPMSAMLRCNGFDEIFDGSRQLEDSDLAYRLGATGLRVILDSFVRVTEFRQKKWETNEEFFRRTPHTKCNGSYFYPIMSNRKRVVANARKLGVEEISVFLRGRCPKVDSRGYCSIGKGDCLGNWKWSRPEDDLDLLLRVYGDGRLVFDLQELRRQRRWETAQEDPLLF
jgi:hypothetical protein